MQITYEQMRQISLNQGKPEICTMVASFITTQGSKYKLDTVYRVKHFLGQTCIESAFFSRLEENLSYSAQRLMQVWPNRFPNLASTQGVALNPRGLANRVYGNRKDLGNGPNDGWPYRGSSIKQITGRYNFTEFNTWIHKMFPSAPDFVKNPDALRTLDWAVWPAVWYWTERNCVYYADRDDAKGLTRVINGGLNGIDDRIKATGLVAKVIGSPTNPTPTVVPPKQPDPLLMEYQGKMQKLSKVMKVPAFDPGDVDGWNGPKTMKAVEAIQRYTKLNVDGKCGPNTRKAINLLCQKYNIPV